MVNKTQEFTKKKIILLVAVILLILIGVFRNQISNVVSFVLGVTVDKTIDLVNRKESFNILLLGIAGGEHDGPELTDTIILANVNIDQKKVHMFSIPRDLWVPEFKRKINTAYAFGQESKKGLELSEKVVSKVTGQEIDYVLVVDFQGFTKLVDYLGGIGVEVQNSFVDREYPITGKENDPCGKSEDELRLLSTASSQLDAFPCRYKEIKFQMGVQKMNGETALEFVRSRHGSNGEGSDFARSMRQQQVINALREKIFSLGVILNPIKVVGMYNILKENIDTNIDIKKVDDFIKLANKMKEGQILSYVIDYGSEGDERYGLVKNPKITEEYSYQWVLIPRRGNGDFSEIHEYIQCIIDGKDCLVGERELIFTTPTVKPTKTQR